MKVVAHMVVGNEADRWLVPVLERLVAQFDTVAVVDDRSTDGTLGIAGNLGCVVVRRPDHVPAWDEHEGQCREWAWRWVLDFVGLSPGDVIVAVDADEAIAGNPVDTISALRAAHPDAAQFEIPIDEIWKVGDTGHPLARIDGQWGAIVGKRIAVVTDEDPQFYAAARACGSTPVSMHPKVRVNTPRFWHLGYLRPDDRQAKYQRYTDRSWRRHYRSHVESIITAPTLRPTTTLTDADRQWWKDIGVRA